MHNKIKLVLSEINNTLSSVTSSDIEQFVELFKKDKNSKNIVISGAGRMGYAAKGFAMRLGHMGYSAWMLGDSTVPHIGKGDLLVVASGSGNTQTIYDIAVRANQNGADIALVTNNPNSKIGKLADTILLLQNNNNKASKSKRSSQQPMTSLNEQCLLILLDSIVLDIMESTGETHESMWARHSNLE
jgi:6-phospho-3-hexuloisomerase